MIASTYNVLLVIACASSYLAISRRVDERLGGIFATISWAVLTASSFGVSVYSGGSEFTTSSDALAFLSVAGGVMMLIFTFAAATSSLPTRNNTRYTK